MLRRPSIALALIALCLTANVSFAAGINLSWSACGIWGQPSRTFACNSNTAPVHVMVGSWMPPAGTTAITGEEIVIDAVSATSTYPAWWSFKNAGTCRQTSHSINADFTAGVPGCGDYWQGQAAGGFGAFNPNINPSAHNRVRILAVFAVAPVYAGPADETVEYGAFQMVINNSKTVGAGACGGCAEPVCFVLNSIKLTQPVNVADYKLVAPLQVNYVTWQGGVVAGGCPAATPTRNATWGSVKALYR